MNKKRYLRKGFFSLCIITILFFLNNNLLFGQISNIISSVRVSDAKEKTPITVTAELFSADNVSSINLTFKSFGQSEFRKVEMFITGTTATATIPADAVEPPYLDYYLVITMRNGSAQTYPIGVDQGVPALQIAVSSYSQKDKEILVLSPTSGEILTQQEMLISVSFIKASDQVDISKTKIFLSGVDVTSNALFTGDLIVLSGENLPDKVKIGSGLLRVDVYDKDGNLYHSLTRSFRVVSSDFAAAGIGFMFNGSLRGESRRENFNSQLTRYNNISADITGNYGSWTLNGNVYITDEEKSDLQPYNRYSFSVKSSDWLEMQVGDSYPLFPNLIMDGKRIRGLNGSLNFGAINVQASYGETDRSIEGKLLEKYTANEVPLGSDIIPINQSKYEFPFGLVELGTFTRKVLAIRPSFGSGENFQFGLSYLHSKDDLGSIEFGARPAENLVLGTDLMFAFDSRNILFTSQAAVSLNNNDITSGTLTDKQIDEIFGSNSNFSINPNDVKRVRNLIGNFITVNQYLGPWNPQEFASLAAEAALSLNYFSNNIRASYIYRGNDFQSFGQSFLRTDVKGINLVDRIRMIDNKLFLSVGYESLQDNLQKTKIATTTFQTFSLSASLFPRMDFPNITIGYNRLANNNGLSITDKQNGMYAIDDITNRITLQLSYDLSVLVKHSTSLSFSTSNKEDNSLLKFNAKFTSGNFNISSYWTSQLTSLFGFVFNKSELFGKLFNYVTLTVGGKYKMMKNKLQLSATLSPSFGDIERQVLEFVADYNVLMNLNLMFQARIYRIPDASTNSIIGLTTRLSI